MRQEGTVAIADRTVTEVFLEPLKVFEDQYVDLMLGFHGRLQRIQGPVREGAGVEDYRERDGELPSVRLTFPRPLLEWHPTSDSIVPFTPAALPV